MQRSQFSEKAERQKWGGVQYRLKLGILLLTIILTIADCSGSIRLMDLAAEKSAAGVVGGPCEYKQYKGKATITSICKKEMPENYAGPSYERYEVKFSFALFPHNFITRVFQSNFLHNIRYISIRQWSSLRQIRFFRNNACVGTCGGGNH